MDFSDFVSGMIDSGGSGRGWRSPVAVLGAGLGAIAGGVLTYEAGEILTLLGAIGSGALFGWLFALFLRGFAVFLLIFVVVLAVMFGWDLLTGAA